MEVRQRVIKARTKSKNTPKLFDLLNRASKESVPSGVKQRVTTRRLRSDGKAKGVAIRKK
jgi:hypothetical protein